MTNFVLASSSPRRRQLLAAAGYMFRVIPPDESAEDGLLPDERVECYVCRLAVQKAQNVAEKIVSGMVIGCDTVVFCNKNILEKPADGHDARRMLTMLRDREHSVLSGLCVLNKTAEIVTKNVRYAETKLRMEQITDAMIDAYLQTGAWQGKAGAFGYQDGNDWLQILEGSESNVAGLPLELLMEMLPHGKRQNTPVDKIPALL
ncbi:MAG: Maf family protein [Planctomycetaceae bacterium]|nr:Maf family protein [Planctomycetaceae bacterium]